MIINRLSLLLGLSLLSISLLSDLVFAQLPKRSAQSALEQIMVSSKIDQDLLSPILTEKIPLPKFQGAIEDLKERVNKELGAYKSVQLVEGEKYRIIFERGIVPTKIRLDKDGRITNILFQYPEKY